MKVAYRFMQNKLRATTPRATDLNLVGGATRSLDATPTPRADPPT